MNNPLARREFFGTGTIGEDNAIARHGIHGLYWRFSIEVPSFNLVRGMNTIYLRQAKASSPFQGIMYDYVRLESPPTNKIDVTYNSRFVLFFCFIILYFLY